jgi:hypothetical protein
MLAEVDPTHRGIARIEWLGTSPALRVLVPEVSLMHGPTPAAAASSPTEEALSAPAGTRASASGPSTTAAPARDSNATGGSMEEAPDASSGAQLQFLREGMRHILTGYDHVLFLICLLLPSVMRRTAKGWQPVDRLSQAVWPVAGIVTAFTVAHSITLALAATGTVSLAPAFIEPAIAATIILAALDNVTPIFGGRRAFVTFAFGLIHGFGFAGVLAELKMPPIPFAWALLQFNVGLELGQLLIVSVIIMMLFLLRRGVHYPVWFIRGGSVTAMVIGALWLVERVVNVSILSL